MVHRCPIGRGIRGGDSHAKGLELAFRFLLWMQGHREVPTWKQIRDHWGVCKATAYRWRNAYLDATGTTSPIPARDPCPAATGTNTTSRNSQ